MKKPTPSPAPETATETETETEAQEDRETPAGDEAESPATDSTVLSQTDVSDSDETTESVESPESNDEDQTEPEPETEQPASVADTVKARLESELQPLIAELTKAGAKGAMAILLKRLPKLTDQRDTERNKRLIAEERVTQLESELAKAADEGRESRVESQSPSTHPAVRAIHQQLGNVDSFIKLFKAHPDGLEMDDGDGGTVQLSAEEVSEHLEKLRDKRTALVAQRSVAEENVRQQYQAAYHQVRAESVKLYPWLDQKDSPEMVRLRNFVKAVPGIKAVPDYERLIARMFRGKAAEEAEARAKAKPAVTTRPAVERKPTAVNTGTPGAKAGAVQSKADKEVADAKARFEQTGSKADLQKWEAAKQRAKRGVQ